MKNRRQQRWREKKRLAAETPNVDAGDASVDEKKVDIGRRMKTVQPQPDKKKVSKKDSARFARDATQIASGLLPLLDARDALWQDGLPILRRLTGKPDGAARALLGKLLRESRDDCARVLAVLHRAADTRPVDPVPWLTEAVKDRRNTENDIARDWDLPTFGSENQF
jgi:hypothetical protein